MPLGKAIEPGIRLSGIRLKQAGCRWTRASGRH